MATLYVTEFRTLAPVPGGWGATQYFPFAAQPPVAEQHVAIGASSASSAAFNASTNYVRLHTDAICSIEFGTSPTAAATAARMAAGQTEYFTVPPGASYKVAVITNS